jgi:hypothetical protein
MFSAAAFCFFIAYLVLLASGFVSFAYVFLFLFSLVAFLGFVSALLTFLSGFFFYVIDHLIFFSPFWVI